VSSPQNVTGNKGTTMEHLAVELWLKMTAVFLCPRLSVWTSTCTGRQRDYGATFWSFLDVSRTVCGGIMAKNDLIILHWPRSFNFQHVPCDSAMCNEHLVFTWGLIILRDRPDQTRPSEMPENKGPVYTVFQKRHVTTFSMISWSRTARSQRFLAHLLTRV